ncbi:MAG: DinB family protein [Candidatus Heimdallarchaeota archaeon]|nr:MAG: DinB family protein [Candidatus Heimdallarchaeota archaeon]
MTEKTAVHQINRIGPVLSREFKSSWNMLRKGIESISEELWNVTVNEWSYGWTAYHIIETAEFYSRNTPKGMTWGKKAGINWEVDSNEIIAQKKSDLTKTMLFSYLEEIENRLIDLLENSSDQYFFETDEFDNGSLLILEKLLYLLRHNMIHLGELNKVLRDRNCKRIRWQ